MDLPTIQVTPSAIRNMLFGFEHLWGERCQSVTTVEPESFYPRRIPLEYAAILEKHDPDGNIFKIFKYPAHAEIWHIDHWNLSASKRMALMERCHKQDDELASRRHKEASAFQKFMRVKDAILVIMPALEYDQRGLSQLCRTLMQAPRELTDKFTGLTAIIHDDAPKNNPQ